MAVLLLVAGSAVVLLNRNAAILYYRVTDDRTVALGTLTGPWTWTRITTLSETNTSVIVGVGSLRAPLPLPGTGDDIVELVIHLADPIGDRAIIDAGSGVAVPMQVDAR